MDDFLVAEDSLGDDPEYVAAALPLIGLGDGFDTPHACVLPAHDLPTAPEAVFRRRTLRYECNCDRATEALGAQEYSAAEVYASIRYGEIRRLRGVSAAVWWNKLFFDAGVLELDLPRVTIESSASAATVMRGAVLLTAIRNQRPDLVGVPFEFSKAFVAAWCDLPPTTAMRLTEALVAQGFLSAERVQDARRRRVKWRYRLTGKGLELAPQHRTLTATTEPA